MQAIDASTNALQRFQCVVEKVEEILQQCSNLIEWQHTFGANYKENLTFIEHGENIINKYNSDSLDPAAQIEKCSVS